MDLLNILPDNLIFVIPSLLLALTVHEFAHAWVSYRLGDPTPKYQGRLTLNPLAHIDPLGLVMLMLFRFGWGKPVEIDPRHYRNRRQGVLLVSLAGPGANIITAFVLMVGYAVWSLTAPGFVPEFVPQLLGMALMYNILIALFNMLPVPPLDGSKVLASILPPKYSYQFQSFAQQWGLFILLALIATGLTGRILTPLSNLLLTGMARLVYTLVGLVL